MGFLDTLKWHDIKGDDSFLYLKFDLDKIQKVETFLTLLLAGCRVI